MDIVSLCVTWLFGREMRIISSEESFLAMEYIFNNKLVQIKDFTLNDYNIYIDIYGERDYVADGYYIIIPDDKPKSVVESEIGFYNNKIN